AGVVWLLLQAGRGERHQQPLPGRSARGARGAPAQHRPDLRPRAAPAHRSTMRRFRVYRWLRTAVLVATVGLRYWWLLRRGDRPPPEAGQRAHAKRGGAI